MKRPTKPSLSASALLLLALIPVSGFAVDTWKTAGPGNWDDTSNWSNGAEPTTGEQTIIAVAGADITINTLNNLAGEIRLGDNTAGNVAVTIDAAGGTALTSGQFTVGRRGGAGYTQTVNHKAGTLIAGSVFLGGSTDFTGSSFYNLTGGSVEASGLSISTTGSGTGTFTASGSGAVTLSKHTYIGGASTGSLVIKDHATLAATGGGTYNFQINDKGSMTINGSDATINLKAKVAFASTATLNFTLDAGGASTINVTAGSLALGGTLNVSLGSFTGSSVVLMDYTGATYSGTFDTINLDGFTATIDYTTGKEVRLMNIVPTAVPEPGAVWLLSGAGASLLLWRRRFRTRVC